MIHALRFAIAASFAAAFSATPADAQTISGAPAIASYHAQGYCLDTRASDRQILLWSCHGGTNQAFRFVSGNYGMISLGDQRCLTSGLTSGSPLTAQTCTNAGNQRWGFQPNGTLRNETGLCADIESGGRSQGVRILGYSCQGSSNQQWYPAVWARSAPLGMAAQRLRGQNGVKVFAAAPGFSGGNIVASGGGNIISNDGGGIISNDGGGIVAGGAGNMLARFGRLIANDGAGIVAGGAGNALPNNWSFFSGAGAGIVAGGAGN